MNQIMKDTFEVLSLMDLDADDELRLECSISKFIFSLCKPPENDKLKWKFSKDGKAEFAKYIKNKIGRNVSRELLDAMYRHYVLDIPSYRAEQAYKHMIGPKRCAICGSEVVTVDHKIPIACGGENNVENLQYLCQKHNSIKNSRIAFVPLFN